MVAGWLASPAHHPQQHLLVSKIDLLLSKIDLFCQRLIYFVKDLADTMKTRAIGGKWLLCANLAEGERPLKQGTLAVLEAETGIEPEWSDLFRALALPPGEIAPHTVGWVKSRQDIRKKTSGEKETAADDLCIQVAVANEAIVVNLTHFIRAYEEDGNFSTQQLKIITDRKPWLIRAVSSRLPHLVNVQERISGETILHYCARQEKAKEICSWLPQDTEAAVFTPIRSECMEGDLHFTKHEETSALHLAIKMHSRETIKALVCNMNANLNEYTGSQVTSAIKLLAQEMPEMVRPCMQVLHGKKLPGWRLKDVQAVDATPLAERKIATTRENPGSAFVLVGANHYVYGSRNDLWQDKLRPRAGMSRFKTGLCNHLKGVPKSASTRRQKEHMVDHKCVLLAGLTGDSQISPLHNIVENCDSSVFEAALLRYAVDYKWKKNVLP